MFGPPLRVLVETVLHRPPSPIRAHRFSGGPDPFAQTGLTQDGRGNANRNLRRVVDEAHRLSKWGHDFRPDYRYVAPFIAENHGEDSASILCLTATAKHDVVVDIREHFERTLESRLKVIDGGAERTNLEFVVMLTSASLRIEHIHRALENALERDDSGCAIVYWTIKRSSEEIAQPTPSAAPDPLCASLSNSSPAGQVAGYEYLESPGGVSELGPRTTEPFVADPIVLWPSIRKSESRYIVLGVRAERQTGREGSLTGTS